jgi:uncharacterized SAM-binding protein YcdF (DUF218 family)
MKSFLRKALRIVIYFHVFVILALILTHCSFTRYANKSFERAKKEKPYDVVIVPGIPYDTIAQSNVMKMRVFWAKYLYDSGFTKNIIFSGSAVYTPYTEGRIMKLMADSLGVPSDHTFSETKAEHSSENVYYSWKLAKEMGFKKIAVASDPYQAGLLRSFYKKHCPGVQAIPIIFGMMDINNKQLPEIDPSSAYQKDFVSIMEREGFWERFRGTMGKRVRDAEKAERAAAKKEKQKVKELLGEQE